MATDKRILYTEYMVGATHPSLGDTINRMPLMDHANSGAHRYISYELTNSAAGSTAVGDVLAVSSATGILGDTVNSLQKYVVAAEIIANAATGRFIGSGPAVAKATGAIAAMQYVRKSATARTIEDAGYAVGATSGPPPGAVGFAMAAAAAGFCTIFLFESIQAAPVIVGKDIAAEHTDATAGLVDLVTISGLNIPVATPFDVRFSVRKTAGFATNIGLSLKLNATSSGESGFLAGGNVLDQGMAVFSIQPRNTGYLKPTGQVTSFGSQIYGYAPAVDMPTVAITSVIIQGNSKNVGVTVAVKDVYVIVYPA